jgi:hypothetical protein
VSETLTIQPSSIDTYINDSTPTTNNGVYDYTIVGEWSAVSKFRTLIKFDLSGLPTNATIISATLSLYCTTDYSGNARTYRVYNLKRAWTEAGATWNKYDGTNDWQTAGATGANDYDSTEIGSRAFSATETLNQFKDFALIPTTKATLDLGNGWLIKADTESNDAYLFSTREAATTANRPKLVIVYTSYQNMTATLPVQTTVTAAIGLGKLFNVAIQGQTTVTGTMTRNKLLNIAVRGQTTVTGNLTGGTTVYDIPTAEALQVTIGGKDYTGYLTMDAGGLIIENALTSRMDTATVTFVATTPDERLAISAITPWQEIIIKRVSDDVVRFAGYVVNRTKQPFLGGQQSAYHTWACQDYSALLQRVHVNTTYSSKTDAFIINALMTTYASDFDGATNVASSKTITSITFNRISIFDALQQVCTETGYDWYVDENKHIHYFSSETYAAPWVLADTGASNAAGYSEFSYQEDASQIKNRVFIYGGTYLSASFSETFIGDASKKIWSLAYTPAATPVITVDAAAQLEGIDGVDNPAYVDVLCNNKEKLIKFTNAPSNTAVILVTYQYSIPILMRVRKQSSYDEYGRWFDHKIIDRNITSTAEATAAGTAILEADAFARETLSITTPVIGFRSGQIARVINDAIQLDDYYLIRRVTGRAISPVDWTMLYTLDLGDWHGDVVDLLVNWQREHAPKMDVRDDEQLNELLDQAEAVTLTDAVAVTAAGTDFYWNSFLWDSAVWG